MRKEPQAELVRVGRARAIGVRINQTAAFPNRARSGASGGDLHHRAHIAVEERGEATPRQDTHLHGFPTSSTRLRAWCGLRSDRRLARRHWQDRKRAPHEAPLRRWVTYLRPTDPSVIRDSGASNRS